ncbi:MAG: uroporphyrinogen-III C-methyltransferase [Polyangiaceae bacterium]
MRQPTATKDSQAKTDPTGAQPGTVYLVGAGPGDPELLTLRGATLLATADVVLHDELVHPAALARVRPDAEVRFVGKRGGDKIEKQARQEEIDRALVDLAKQGLRVVRLKGGDPYLFGRGSEEAEALARAGVPFEVVPGVTSPIAAAAYAGISLTHRDLASSVTFVSGTTRAGRPFDFAEIAGVSGTICVLMGMRRIEDVTRGLVTDARRDPATPTAVIENGTRSEQRTVTGRLDEIAAKARALGMANPAMIVVGAVTTLRDTIRWFDKNPLFGRRVLVVRAEGQAEGAARLVRRRGAEPISFPAIVLQPPPDPDRVTRAIRELGAYDLVAFTSENGVARFLDRLREEGLDARAFGRAKIAAIGSGTAASLAPYGLVPDIVPKDFVGEALAKAILDALGGSGEKPDGSRVRVLIPRALVAREVVPDALRAAGCDVDVVPVYETVAPPKERREALRALLEAGRVDVVMLTSSSTVTHLAELIGDDATTLLAPVLLASIGPITTETARKRGLTVAVTAEVSTIPGLITAIEAHLAKDTERP